ncbi:MAG TPA: BtpA/SgcQ family protein [Planctomycetes bacterium]|nr:BtpA/SgcQ family protein [Planctomycetota bacterium]
MDSGKNRPPFTFERGGRQIIGVVHLLPLPGSPRGRPLPEILGRCTRDASALIEGGVDAIIVENFGDVPFLPGRVAPETVAAMSLAVANVIERVSHTRCGVGVNVLRNDADSALAIASVTGAQFIRVNVHTSAMLTDQGWIEGRAAETLRRRASLGHCGAAGSAGKIEIAADIAVKHALAPAGFNLCEAARDATARGLADAVIVTGVATGAPPAEDDLRAVREAVPDAILIAGSGTTRDSVGQILDIADATIVGSWLKVDGDVEKEIDLERVRALVCEARG